MDVKEMTDLLKLQRDQLEMIESVTQRQTQGILDILERGLEMRLKVEEARAEFVTPEPEEDPETGLSPMPTIEEVDATLDKIFSDADPMGLAGDDPSLQLET